MKIIAILSDNKLLYQAIIDNNIGHCILFQQKHSFINFLEQASLVDMLIIDKAINPNLLPYYKIATILNLTNQNFVQNEIKITKPFQLFALLKLVNDCQNSNYLFFALRDDLIYDERLSSLRSPERSIKLTAKENQVLKILISSSGHKINKIDLSTNVWHHNIKTESTTIDVHLYKLKQKLSGDLLQIHQDGYTLTIVSKEKID